jgi:arabinan endo-1,5-alpha-L-arabinosidase
MMKFAHLQSSPVRLRLIFTLLAGLSLFVLAGCVARQSAPPAISYRNPVYTGSLPDPSVFRHPNGWYYAVGTTGNDRKADGRIFTLVRSTNLVHWAELGGALEPADPSRALHYWAPEAVVGDDGRSYLYYSVGRPDQEKFELRVAVSVAPEGPYRDTGKPLLDCQTNRFTIDPFPFRDDDGQWYLFYACNFPFRSPGKHPGTGIKAARLRNMTELDGECQEIVRPAFDWTLYQANRHMPVYNETFDWHTIEGPCVIKRGGKYYCFYSGANWQTPRYGVDYVVADHPLGPYSGQGENARVLSGIPGEVRGPGHHSIIRSPDGQFDVIAYHAWDPAMKLRRLHIDPLLWTPEGPRCDGPSFTERKLQPQE